MQDSEFVWLDVRWHEPGWLLAFRIRLTGWLPAKEAEAGRAHDVIRSVGDDAGTFVELTQKGLCLTEVSAHSHEEHNVRILADVLRHHGFRSNWLSPREGEGSALLTETQGFEIGYKEQILRKLKRQNPPRRGKASRS